MLLPTLVLSALVLGSSFAPSSLPSRTHLETSSSLFEDASNHNLNSPTIFDRRDVLSVLLSTWVICTPSQASAAAAAWGASPERPVAVLGANGKTGMEVVQTLAKQGLYTVSMTRTGVDPFRVIKLPTDTKDYITHYAEPVDVVSIDSLQQAMQATKASAIIFCASSSRQGGTAFEVDDQGVANAAQVAKNVGARLVVISALALDRPESKSYKMTNTLGGRLQGIMDAKRQGETKLRKALADKKDYMIIRPGPLMNGKSTGGPDGIEINQGDTIGGGLSRDELAGVAVGALRSGKKGVTVEVYRKSTATKLQPEYAIPSGRERSADSYEAMFEKVVVDDL
jgi:uncharacterized protein YbjT (DUF2867 family)